MTARKPLDTKAFTLRPKSSKYETGYGKPPQATRFKPGQSGNPAGRPKGAKNKTPALNGGRLRDIILGEAYREVSVRDGAQNITVPIAQAVVRSLTVAAVKGNGRAQRLFTELLHTTEREKAAQDYALLDIVIGYKVEWERELERRARMGIEGPEPFPHPDNIIVDFVNGSISITGPMTKQEKAEIDEEIEGAKWLKGKIEADREDVQGKRIKVQNTRTPKRLQEKSRHFSHFKRSSPGSVYPEHSFDLALAGNAPLLIWWLKNHLDRNDRQDVKQVDSGRENVVIYLPDNGRG